MAKHTAFLTSNTLHRIMKTSFFLLATALAHTPLFAAPPTLSFQHLSTVQNGVPAELFAKSAAEIVKFDPVTKRMFVVNGATDSIDIFDAADPESPVFIESVDISAYGNPNSVDINPNSKANEIAVAVGADDKTQRGNVVFISKDGDILGEPIQVGYLPDMLTYDAKGGKLLVANEGEPNDDYTVDPEGSVSIISINGRRRTHFEVTFSHLTLEDVPGVRITGPEGTTVAQDLEPEFIAIEGHIAFVTCQENNAVAKIDIAKKRVLAVMPLGSINHAELGNAIDFSDRDFDGSGGGGGIIRIANWPVRGLLMPDAIATYSATIEEGSKKRGTFFVTANEGDARDYGDYSDETRVSSSTLDPSAFPLGNTLKLPINIGRLNIVNTEGKIDGGNVHDQLFSFGTRSFSIFDENAKLVFDSGEMIETYIAENYPDAFNSTHDEGDSFDTRSDNKGPEPESVVIGAIGDRTYAFIGLERFSGILACDITNPRDVKFAGFGMNRDFGVEYDEENLTNVADAGDLGPEGLDFVPAKKSPNGQPLLVVANEVSGTTTIYQISDIVDR
jgi:2',3'-cyclic-nucleotide 2'-phosphodiesterase/3'-nucleotidase/5'-nucleotidase